MTDPIRQKLIEQDRARKNQRQSLQVGMLQAKHDLHPKILVERWITQKKSKLSAVTQSTRQNLEKNAPFIGVAGLAVLLFTARKPISRLWMRLRERSHVREEHDEQAG
jgi:hypothetical protein